MFDADVAIDGERISVIAPRVSDAGRVEVDARGRVVAPGFINVLSWAAESLLHDGRGVSDVVQGVTMEVFGEGESMGPLSPESREWLTAQQGDITYDVSWTSLAEFLDHLVELGVSPNVGSFVGATTVRANVIGWNDVRASTTQLQAMVEQVRQAMRDGALGVGSSLIYTPACFADTAELMALAGAAAESDGLYISHIRDEGSELLTAIDEFVRIARETGVRAEVYHLKAAGRENWGLIDDAIAMLEGARADGLSVTADMYPYAASATGLDATMPPWVIEGGLEQWYERLRDPQVRAKVAAEMRTAGVGWENELHSAGGGSGVLLVGFRTPELQGLAGRTIADVASERSSSPEDTIMDLVVEDRSRVSAVYFNQSEEVVRRVAGTPWVAIGSDEATYADEGVFLRTHPHPRAYGSFAKFVGRFVREGVVGLADGIHRVTELPARTLRLTDRGRLLPGRFADVVVLDPDTLTDTATFDAPHRYATGVDHVFVNGVHTVADGAHTGARAGQVVRGPGYHPAAGRASGAYHQQ